MLSETALLHRYTSAGAVSLFHTPSGSDTNIRQIDRSKTASIAYIRCLKLTECHMYLVGKQ